MALADFFGRNATAAAQILDNFEESGFRERVSHTRIAVAFGSDAASPEGHLLLDLLVRLLARFYGRIVFRGDAAVGDHIGALTNLARSINPKLEFDDGPIDAQISVGTHAPGFDGKTIYAGSDGWDAMVSGASPQPIGDSQNPLGPGAAASIAVARLFRSLFLSDDELHPEADTTLSTRNLALARTRGDRSLPSKPIHIDAHIVGIGAIGNSLIWALSALPLKGTIRLIDHQSVELSNLQRYVLAGFDDVGRSKVDVGSKFLAERVDALVFEMTWAQFVQAQGNQIAHILVAVDSSKDRMAIQASLPAWVANGWTQPGDLGVSVHGPFNQSGACLNCLYLPPSAQMSEDEIISRALGIPDRLMQIRELLYNGAPLPQDVLEAVATSFGVPLESVLPFANRPVRELYVQGICGGAVLPLGKAGTPHQDVHVPVAHQSSLAGILLAGAFVNKLLDGANAETQITRINLLRPIAGMITQPALKDPRGICICQDSDYLDAYNLKYGHDETAI